MRWHTFSDNSGCITPTPSITALPGSCEGVTVAVVGYGKDTTPIELRGSTGVVCCMWRE